MLTTFLHTGLAVPSLESSIKWYQSLGFEVVKKFTKSDIEAEVAMVQKEGVTLELFQFNNPNHPHVQFIRNHLAFYSDSLEQDIEELVSKGFKIVIPITNGMVYRFAFLQDSAGTVRNSYWAEVKRLN